MTFEEWALSLSSQTVLTKGVLELHLYQLTGNMHKTTLKNKTRILVVDGLNIA